MKFTYTILRLLAALALLLIAVVAVYAWRSFPSLSGQLQVPGLLQSVQIQRDSADVTHIKAASERDAAFAMGYTHAQERSWQLEFNRRIMHGELSEILGAATLETDKLMRTLGILRAAQKQLAGMPADMQDALHAYANGVNAFHATSAQALPPEFHVLRVKPGLWTAADSMAWGVMMALDLGGNWGTEFARLAAAQKINTAQLWQLFPPYPGEQPASKTDFAKLYADLGVYNTQPPGATKTIAACAGQYWGKCGFDEAIYAQLGQSMQEWTQDVGTVEGKGSNNWVVAGSRSASGKPLLANDPHLALGAPAIWYFARLQYPGVDVIGATLPGLPTVVLGRTAKVAWGFTNTGPDVQDLYLEQINPANAAQYKTPDGFQDFVSHTEAIKVKGQGDVAFTWRETRHGPVISDAQAAHGDLLDLKKYVIALRWAGLDADNRTVLAGRNASRAQSVDELFAAYADYHSPMQNVVAADASGTIRYKAVGKVPLRAADNDIRGIAPAPGWEARYDWTGWLPYDQTPRDDGAKGWVSTANQRIHVADYPHFMGQDWATPHRFDRIETLLAGTEKHDVASMQKMHGDVVSNATASLSAELKKLVQKPAVDTLWGADVVKAITDFDGAMRASSPGALIAAMWADELARGMIAPKLGETKFKAMYGKRHFRGTVDWILKSNDAFWCAPKTCDQQSADALNRALDRIRAMQGNDVTQWQWGKAHEARSTHKPFGNVPLLARFFDVAAPSGGDPWSVNVGQYWLNEKQPFHNRHAASLRAVYDLADLEKSQFIYQTGQSGLVFSSRYRDMSAQWIGRADSASTSVAIGYRKLQMQPDTFVNSLTLQP